MDEQDKMPVFDLDRLARDINQEFQGILKTQENAFEHATKNIVDNRAKELDRLVQEKKNLIRAELVNSKEELIAEIQKGRTTIVIGDTTANSMTITARSGDHPKLESVVKSLVLSKKAMLVGPTGTGKTHMIGQIAERMDIPFYKYSCSRDSSVHDLLGYKQPTSETYLETSFLKCYENGGIFLVDEYDAMSGDMALFFNGVADSSKFLSVPHRDEKPQAIKHKDFHIVMCGNTWGNGSVEYSGRDFQDKALMDRFRFCRHYIDYHVDLEASMLNQPPALIKLLRKSLESVGSYISTRNIEDMGIAIGAGMTMKEAVYMLIHDLDEGEQKQIVKNLVGNNSYSHLFR